MLGLVFCLANLVNIIEFFSFLSINFSHLHFLMFSYWRTSFSYITSWGSPRLCYTMLALDAKLFHLIMLFLFIIMTIHTFNSYFFNDIINAFYFSSFFLNSYLIFLLTNLFFKFIITIINILQIFL